MVPKMCPVSVEEILIEAERTHCDERSDE